MRRRNQARNTIDGIRTRCSEFASATRLRKNPVIVRTQSEICDLQIVVLVDEKILRLDIAMVNTVAVQMRNSGNKLSEPQMRGR